MVIALLLWTLAVAGVWWFADLVLAFLTPGAAWLQANPDLAAWIEPTVGFFGTLGVSAAVIVWLAGVALIALVSRRTSPAREGRRSLSWSEWRQMDGGDNAPPPRRRDWSGLRRRDDDYEDDDEDRYRRRRRKRRDDDDDDDDDD